MTSDSPAPEADRVAALRSLIDGSDPLGVAVDRLAVFPFDSEPLVDLSRSDVVRMLLRFIDGDIPADDVAQWAEALEAREDVAADHSTQEALFVLANPAINGVLTVGVAEDIAAGLLSNASHGSESGSFAHVLSAWGGRYASQLRTPCLSVHLSTPNLTDKPCATFGVDDRERRRGCELLVWDSGEVDYNHGPFDETVAETLLVTTVEELHQVFARFDRDMRALGLS